MKRRLYIVLFVLSIVVVLALGLTTKVLAQTQVVQGIELGDATVITAYWLGTIGCLHVGANVHCTQGRSRFQQYLQRTFQLIEIYHFFATRITTCGASVTRK